MKQNKYAKFTIQFHTQLKQGYSFEISYKEMDGSTLDKKFKRLLEELRKAGVLIWREEIE